MPFFTIIIPVLNEEKYLPLLLSDLSQQSYQDFKVIVVDANSQDKTVAKCLTFEKNLDLTVIQTAVRNVSRQRNLGAQNAKSTWIIFMDADNRLPDHFLDGIRYQLAKNKKTDLFTTLINTEGNDPLDTTIQHVVNLTLELYRSINRHAGFGAMIGCKKKVFSKIKFDEKISFSEDSLFLQEAVSQGFECSVFREPRYFYSLRRIKKEGTLNMIRKTASLHLDFLQGKREFAEDRYPMLGGGYYEQNSPRGLFISFHELQDFLKKASQKQLEQARKILKVVKMNS
jgi:glycosyltransferase involved in cell wall biosynthesis